MFGGGRKGRDAAAENGDTRGPDYGPRSLRGNEVLASKRSFALVANAKRSKELELRVVEWP